MAFVILCALKRVFFFFFQYFFIKENSGVLILSVSIFYIGCCCNTPHTKSASLTFKPHQQFFPRDSPFFFSFCKVVYESAPRQLYINVSFYIKHNIEKQVLALFHLLTNKQIHTKQMFFFFYIYSFKINTLSHLL